jgi:hypothetical protein
MEMRPLEAQCHLALGLLAGKSGDHTQAREQLDTAAGMFREMGMTFWLDQAQAALSTQDAA